MINAPRKDSKNNRLSHGSILVSHGAWELTTIFLCAGARLFHLRFANNVNKDTIL